MSSDAFPNSTQKDFSARTMGATPKQRITAAARELISASGGIEAAAQVCGYSKSHVGRWGNHAHADIVPLCAVLMLEAHTGVPAVTRAMAAVHDLNLMDPQGDATSFAGAFASLTREKGELATLSACMMADGVITPHESQLLDRAAADVQAALTAFRATLAQTHVEAKPVFENAGDKHV